MTAPILHLHSIFSMGGKEARARSGLRTPWPRGEHMVLSAALVRRRALGGSGLEDRRALPRRREGAGAGRPAGSPAIGAWPATWPISISKASYKSGRDGRRDGAPPVWPDARPAAAGPSRGWLQRGRTGSPEGPGCCFGVVALGTAFCVVVPSARLSGSRGPIGMPADAHHADRQWRATRTLCRTSSAGFHSGFLARAGDVVVGTMAGLRGVKNLPGSSGPFARLVQRAAGDRGGRAPSATILRRRRPKGERSRAAARLPARCRPLCRHFDIFALSSDSEQFPISLVEAMAAGCPWCRPRWATSPRWLRRRTGATSSRPVTRMVSPRRWRG